MLPCHQYQLAKCRELELRPVLNVACKEDPPGLGKHVDAVNLDINDYDPQERLNLYSIPNFQVGSALDIPFADDHFGIVVLGEFIEHCKFPEAKRALIESRRVCRSGGFIVMTFPLDGRPKEVQHAPHLLVVWEDDITSWHQTVWENELFQRLLDECKMRELSEHRKQLEYGFCQGWGVVVQ
jgi:SAM-dependent methyltransferase